MRLINMTTTAPAPARSRWLLPAGAAAAVAVLVAVVAIVSAVSGSGPAQPPVLHLASVSGASVGLPASAAAGVWDKSGTSGKGGAPVSGARGSGWRLEGTLPTGTSTGRVYLLPAGPTTRTFVNTLARALGMSGEPQHLKGGWYLVSGTTELSVSELAGQHWTYSNHGCVAGPVLDPQTGVACAVAKPSPPTAVPVKPDVSGAPVPAPAPGARGSKGVTPAPTAGSPVTGVGPVPTPVLEPVPTPVVQPVPVTVVQPVPVSENVARRLARPILDAVGVNPDAARVDTEGGQQSVVLVPKVGGSTVIGLETRVSVDEQGQVVDASGWVAAPTAAAAYPLISARQGYDQLLQQPQPMMALAIPCRIVPGTQGCAPIPDRVVTGATLGLTQAFSTDRGILLVPAWLFQVRGQSTPVAVVAVQRSFLGQPDQPAPGTGPSVGGQPGSVGSEPGSVGGGSVGGGSVGGGSVGGGTVGGGSAPNGSTEVTGAPTQLEKGGPATAPATTPTQSPR